MIVDQIGIALLARLGNCAIYNVKCDGYWFIDVSTDREGVTIQWPVENEDSGPYGISIAGTGGYGEGPAESYDDLSSLIDRAVALLNGS
jgi:hypothetical protein